MKGRFETVDGSGRGGVVLKREVEVVSVQVRGTTTPTREMGERGGRKELTKDRRRKKAVLQKAVERRPQRCNVRRTIWRGKSYWRIGV